jgi:HD-GYP domain-containing protein (c-di-GMP phosphodiesterase class II)
MRFLLICSKDVRQVPPALRWKVDIRQFDVDKIASYMDGDRIVGMYLSSEDFQLCREKLTEIPPILLFNPDSQELEHEVILDEVQGTEADLTFKRRMARYLKTLSTQTELKRIKKINEELLSLGVALSAERDNNKLLDSILNTLRELTCADAGSLYLITDDEDPKLHFKITQNSSNQTDFTEFIMPLDKCSISGWTAIHKEIVNIADVYFLPPESEISFNKSYDETTGYRSKSMLTVPMVDHHDKCIGVIQLINRKDKNSRVLNKPQHFEKYVSAFDESLEPLVMSLASQAAVSLENNQLYNEIEELFEGFVRASVKAIESRDPTTSGHSMRVANFSIGLAAVVDRVEDKLFNAVKFSREQLKELRYASLLHDFGKVGVRENVLVKAKKLYPYQMEIIQSRFELIERSLEISMQQRRFEMLKKGELSKEQEKELKNEYLQQCEELRTYLNGILSANEPQVLAEEPLSLLNQLEDMSIEISKGRIIPYLKPEELEMLKIPRGSLNQAERVEIESHVQHTFAFLKQIPWTKDMKNVPDIALRHHEKLDGSGYPHGVSEIPIQSRIMTISDIFDALTARDRPYKAAVPVNKALDILGWEAEAGKIDNDLLKLFIESKVYEHGESENKG